MRLASRSLVFALVVALSVIGPLACQPAEREATDAGEATEAAPETSSEAHVVEMRTTDYAFHAPARLPAGWNTFRMTNEGEETHFFVLWFLPEGVTFEDWAGEAAAAFEEPFARYRAGELDQQQLMNEIMAGLPEWFPSVVGMGGVGLTAPGITAQTTVELEPGDYAMECYAVSPEGKFHNMLGMLRPLTVTDEPSGASPPEADVEVTLSNYEIATQGELTPGEHTVRVNVTEEPEGLLGHDVHLARLDEGTSLEAVAAWMSWVDGLRPPAPAEFVGGAEQVPAGQTSYFTVDLEPGRYAWISEGYAQRGMVKEFTVE